MNILIVSHSYVQSNARQSSFLRHGAQEPIIKLAEKDHKIYELITRVNFSQPYQVIYGIDVIYHKPLFVLNRLGYPISFPLQYFKRLVKDLDIDLINGRGLQSTNVLCAGILSNYFSKVPFVLSILGASITTGYPLVDAIAKCYDLTFGSMLAKSAKKVIVLSNKLGVRAQKLGVPLRKISVCPPGVDTDRFNPIKFERPSIIDDHMGDESFVVGFVGRFVPLKGIMDLISAAKIVSKKYKLHLLLVGDGPLRSSIEKLTHSFNIPCTITGWVNDPERYYSLMDVFILPSYSEGFPRTCLEAMAMEKPLILTDVGANTELVSDGNNGFIVPPGNPRLLASKIIEMIENKYLISKWGKKNRKIVQKKYNLEKEVETLEKIYYEAID